MADRTPVEIPTLTAAATATPAATVTPTTTPTATRISSATGSPTVAPTTKATPVVVTLSIELRDNFFAGDIENGGVANELTRLLIPAGKVRIVARNLGVDTHNFDIYTEQGGESIIVTDPFAIGPGGDGVLETAIEPGTYWYQCDFHPAEMLGELTVEDRAGNDFPY